MRLDAVARELGLPPLAAGGEVEITSLAFDSRRVSAGSLFFCVPGLASDGHRFAGQAVAAGAVALVCERPLDSGLPEFIVSDARAAMAPVAAAFYREPSSELPVVGITGTNGKTTTAFLLRDILETTGIPTGLVGTVTRVVGGVATEPERTTPEAIDLQAGFREMVDAGDRAAVIEVSSHALEMHRCDAIRFEVAVFTNLTQDHLDFHPDMESYFLAKRKLFESGPGSALINVDDPWGRRLAEEFEVTTFSAAGAEADLVATGVDFDATGATFTIETTDRRFPVRIGLPGAFNVANALAAFGSAVALGVDPGRAADALAEAGRVPGRLEPVDEGQQFAVLVDYAHTPDSIANVLEATRSFTPGRTIAVYGAGGDRDHSKRPLMGRAGTSLADLTVITSDNPRSEDPGSIIDQILAGVEPGAKVEVEPDRDLAIGRAIGLAEPGDAVVIAGKGHEQGQEFADGHRIDFDDREVARRWLRKRSGGQA